MKSARDASTELVCPACGGTGLEQVTQPTEPGRRIFPAKCKQCDGKGRIKKPQSSRD